MLHPSLSWSSNSERCRRQRWPKGEFITPSIHWKDRARQRTSQSQQQREQTQDRCTYNKLGETRCGCASKVIHGKAWWSSSSSTGGAGSKTGTTSFCFSGDIAAARWRSPGERREDYDIFKPGRPSLSHRLHRRSSRACWQREQWHK